MQSNDVILAAAGSGKTYSICLDAISESKQISNNVLLVSYTNRGVTALQTEFKKINYGIIEKNIIIKTWYQFLLSEIIKPYQSSILNDINIVDTYDFSKTYGFISKQKKGSRQRYLSGGNKIISNFASELCMEIFNATSGLFINRLLDIYSKIYIDEIQDLAGNDLDLVEKLFDSNIKIMLVGDSKQTTYKTHNTRTKRNLSGENIYSFLNFYKERYKINIQFNNYSRRCIDDICCFANQLNPKINSIESANTDRTGHDGVFLIEEKVIDLYFQEYQPQVLRYDSKSKSFGYPVMNFGQSKGLTFDRVLIIPNGPMLNFIEKGIELKSSSKYYIGVTRAKFSIAIVVKTLIENDKFYKRTIILGKNTVQVSVFKVQK